MATYEPELPSVTSLSRRVRGLLNSTASADVVAGRLVSVSGDDTVAHAAADSTSVVGVAANDATTGGKIAVWPLAGVVSHTLSASGAISAGAGLVADDDGEVQTAAIGTAAGGVVRVVGRH